MLVGTIIDTFEIKDRGVVVVTGTAHEHLPGTLKLKIGNPIELRVGGEVVLRTKIVSIEHCDPWSPKHTFGFLAPLDVTKADFPVGAEVWSPE